MTVSVGSRYLLVLAFLGAGCSLDWDRLDPRRADGAQPDVVEVVQPDGDGPDADADADADDAAQDAQENDVVEQDVVADAGCNCGAGEECCDGVCVDVQTSASNCGGCGNVCNGAANSRGVCNGGRCGIACNTGFANCDGNAANGCETNTQTSASHCGRCDNACGAVEMCCSGMCALTCM